jgi:hypothetical protein
MLVSWGTREPERYKLARTERRISSVLSDLHACENQGTLTLQTPAGRSSKEVVEFVDALSKLGAALASVKLKREFTAATPSRQTQFLFRLTPLVEALRGIRINTYQGGLNRTALPGISGINSFFVETGRPDRLRVIMNDGRQGTSYHSVEIL